MLTNTAEIEPIEPNLRQRAGMICEANNNGGNVAWNDRKLASCAVCAALSLPGVMTETLE
jgi:hypothetical protein